jgi:transcriptional regulator with XRE-family HTH domain
MTIIRLRDDYRPMSNSEDDQKTWLEELLVKHSITATELARRADIHPSTLTRFLSPEGRDGHVLSIRTIRKIEKTLQHSPTEQRLREMAHFAEPEARPYELDGIEASPVRAALQALKTGRNGVEIWEIGNDTLEGIRLFRGDLLTVDNNAIAMPGDIVCAQKYDRANRGRPETIFRLYEPPFLLTGSMDPELRKPLAVDGQNVIVTGVVVARFSPRTMLRGRAAA